MKKNSTILLLTAVTAAAVTAYLLKRRSTKRMLSKVSDEGYETAADVLYPGKKVGGQLRYGPVLPE